MNDQKVVLFNIGVEEYGIDIHDVISIEKMQPLTAIPKTPTYVTGITSIRGIVTPVFDLRLALGKTEAVDTEATRMIVIQLDGKPIGLVTDSATEVIDIPASSIQDPIITGLEEKALLKGISRLGERLVIILDIQHLLKDMQVHKLMKEMEVA